MQTSRGFQAGLQNLCASVRILPAKRSPLNSPNWLPLVATVAAFWLGLAAFVRRNLMKVLKSKRLIVSVTQEVASSSLVDPVFRISQLGGSKGPPFFMST